MKKRHFNAFSTQTKQLLGTSIDTLAKNKHTVHHKMAAQVLAKRTTLHFSFQS